MEPAARRTTFIRLGVGLGLAAGALLASAHCGLSEDSGKGTGGTKVGSTTTGPTTSGTTSERAGSVLLPSSTGTLIGLAVSVSGSTSRDATSTGGGALTVGPMPRWRSDASAMRLKTGDAITPPV